MDIREKRVAENTTIGFDFSAELGTSEQIASATATASNGLNASAAVIGANNTQVSSMVSNGTAGNYYSVTIKATTNAGNIIERLFFIRVVADTVPSAANANAALVRLDEAKNYIGKTTDEDTAIIELLIDAISKDFNAYTGRNLARANYANEEYDGNGKQIMYLRNYPVSGNMTIIEDDITLTAGNDNDYLCYNNEGRLHRVNKTWYYGAKKILVTYTAGYNCTSGTITLPHDLRLAALKQIAFEFSRYQKKDWGLDSITYPDGTVARQQIGLLRDVELVLDRYRRYTL